MLPDRVSNPGPLTYESGALPIALRGPAVTDKDTKIRYKAYFDTLLELSWRNCSSEGLYIYLFIYLWRNMKNISLNYILVTSTYLGL